MTSGAWEPLEKRTLRTIYTRLNRYLKYLFKETCHDWGRTARKNHGRDRRENRHYRGHDRAAGARLLRQGKGRRGAGAGIRSANPGLGAASRTDVRVLVVGGADVRPLS